MPTLDATVGGASSTSYIDVAAADLYFDNRLHATAWTGATSDDKERALNMATRELDSRVEWEGLKAETAQALAWPRYGLYDDDGYSLATDALPDELVNACCEFALILLGQDTTAPAGTAGFEAMKIGPIDLKFDKGDRVKAIPDIVFAPLAKWGSRRSRGVIEMVRG